MGCAANPPEKSGIDRSSVVIESMEKVHENVLTVKNELNEIETSLSEVIRTGHPDVQGAYTTFSKNVNELENSVDQLIKNSDMLKENSDNYLQSWQGEDDEYENSRLQEISEERRSELRVAFDEIQNSRSDTEQDLKSFVKDVKDIRNFLDNDLTAAGVESVTDLARDVLNESDELQDQLNEMEYALEDAMSEMARRGN